jgi:hypothetical protein
VLLLIKENEELMMRRSPERMMLLLRLFALLVARKAIRVMLVLRMRNGVSVVCFNCNEEGHIGSQCK